jgi:hypothetical protein
MSLQTPSVEQRRQAGFIYRVISWVKATFLLLKIPCHYRPTTGLISCIRLALQPSPRLFVEQTSSVATSQPAHLQQLLIPFSRLSSIGYICWPGGQSCASTAGFSTPFSVDSTLCMDSACFTDALRAKKSQAGPKDLRPSAIGINADKIERWSQTDTMAYSKANIT